MKTVILTSFTNSTEAHMLQDLLKNEGIDSILQGEYINQIMGPLRNFGVQVVVFDEDLERAKIILNESFPNQ